MSGYDEQRLADLIAALRPPPEAWVRAAQELPLARATMDDIVARATADVEYRQQVIADLESALAAAGFEPRARFVEELRARLLEP
jgi:hypothetical protein